MLSVSNKGVIIKECSNDNGYPGTITKVAFDVR